MLAYLYFGILVLVLGYSVREIRESWRKGERLGADPPDADVGADLSLDTSSFSHHHAAADGECDAGGHDAGGFDCGGHGGFDGGGHH